MPSTDVPALLIFDLDGLLIDSLDTLSDAMIRTAETVLSTDESKKAFEAEDYRHPGRSRYAKLELALDLAQIEGQEREVERLRLLSLFDELSMEARTRAQLDETIFQFADLGSQKVTLALLTNCDNLQLSVVAKHHGLDQVFGEAMFGTPPSKEEVFPRIKFRYFNHRRVLSISDSESDMNIASSNGAEFILIKKYARELEFSQSLHGASFESLYDFLEDFRLSLG